MKRPRRRKSFIPTRLAGSPDERFSFRRRLHPPWFAPNPFLPNPILMPPSMPAAACGRRVSHGQAGGAPWRAKVRCLLHQDSGRSKKGTGSSMSSPSSPTALRPPRAAAPPQPGFPHPNVKDFGPDPAAVVVQSTPHKNNQQICGSQEQDEAKTMPETITEKNKLIINRLYKQQSTDAYGSQILKF